MSGAARALLAGGAADAGARLLRGVLDLEPPGGQERWTRTNHRGEPVSLLAGPATAGGSVLGALIGGPDRRSAAAAALGVASAGVFGLVDDLYEDPEEHAKGMRGHLGALRHGHLTTGGLKLLGIGSAAVLAAGLLTPRTGARTAWCVDTLVSGALLAGTANLVNLLDLRPGRARKAVLAAAAPLALAGGPGSGTAAAAAGAAWAGLAADLAEQDMLGDSGANALGALVGAAVVTAAGRRTRLGVLAGVVGLTLASERVSFTRVIEGTGLLRAIDAWGRRLPAAPPRGTPG